MVDENQDKKWECPECSSMRAERRSLAAQRARLKRSSQGKAIGRSVLSLITWGGGVGGRAGVNFRAGASVCYRGNGVKQGDRGGRGRGGNRVTAQGGGWRCRGRATVREAAREPGERGGEGREGSVHVSNAPFKAWLGQPSFFFLCCCWSILGDNFHLALCLTLLLGSCLLILPLQVCWCVDRGFLATSIDLHRCLVFLVALCKENGGSGSPGGNPERTNRSTNKRKMN